MINYPQVGLIFRRYAPFGWCKMTPHMVDGMKKTTQWLHGFPTLPCRWFCCFVYGNCKVACAVAVADVDCRVNLMPGESKTIADFMLGGFKYYLFSWYNIYRMMIWNKNMFFKSISQIIHFQSASCQKQMATTCQVWDWMRFFKNSLAVGDSDYWSFSAQSGTKTGNTKNNPVVHVYLKYILKWTVDSVDPTFRHDPIAFCSFFFWEVHSQATRMPLVSSTMWMPCQVFMKFLRAQ